jgi:hypothetical protein
MGEMAKYVDYDRYFDVIEYTNWDADKVTGCACDKDWEGFDCSERRCPWGVDPEQTVSSGWVDETQLLECTCPDVCTGSITLSYKGYSTMSIPYNAGENMIQAALNELPTVEDVLVEIVGSGKVCPAAGATTKITFLRDVSRMTAYQALEVNSTYLASTGATPTTAIRTKGAASTVDGQTGTTSVISTKNILECSGRGTCNAEGVNDGKCTCYDGYSSSDGRSGLAGETWNYRDCGYFNPAYNWTQGGFVDVTCPVVKPQWGGSAVQCGGVGTCSNKICTCPSGYEGGACEWLTCPSGTAWFDKATASTTAHAFATCSNRGSCSRKNGACGCEELFVDSTTCSVMACAKNESYVCGDKGVCMTMNKLATYSMTSQGEATNYNYHRTDETWDANKIQTCYCRKAMSHGAYEWGINDLMDTTYLQTTFPTYRGYYSRTHTDFTGYDCSKMDCPKGDDPDTFGYNEVQKISCSATAGGFYLQFRENTTEWINWWDTANTLETKLEGILTVGNISVTYYNDTANNLSGGHGRPQDPKGLCNTTYVEIEFLSELGDLPMLKVYGSTLEKKHGLSTLASIPKINVTETQQGTKENVECSAHGYCNADIGMCTCEAGYYSSDGQGNPGHRGDCGFKYTDTQIFLPMEENVVL